MHYFMVHFLRVIFYLQVTTSMFCVLLHCSSIGWTEEWCLSLLAQFLLERVAWSEWFHYSLNSYYITTAVTILCQSSLFITISNSIGCISFSVPAANIISYVFFLFFFNLLSLLFFFFFCPRLSKIGYFRVLGL